MRVTRADVARHAGVSPSTVSYVFSGARPIGDETRQKVLSVARELGYVPNAYAANLAARNLRTIGIHLNLTRSGLDRSSAEYVTGMMQRCTELGLTLLAPTTVGNDEDTFRTFLRSRLLDGVIYMEVEQDDWREDVLLSEKVPAVALGFSGRKGGVPYVETDFDVMGRIAVDECIACGHRSALLIGRQPYDAKVADRVGKSIHRAAKNRARERGFHLDEMMLPVNFLAAQQVIPLMRDNADEHPVIIADNMPVAEGMIGFAADHGLELARDYSIVTLGGQIGYTADTAFDLSEVSTDREQMGRQCVDLLVEASRAKSVEDLPNSVVCEPRFIDRGSLASLVQR
ncbi:LacI family DNA-binding transcriptional regulator [Gleimia europaea]|uniref:LacI family DNA-binding transcriptional regulator n=1 Tax=Gleimia europaea TaxID=66228 RepID=UPI00277E1852|nr:LacI family DNA-binding transcriptional regulator [Gleimia europaea]MDP9833943.1 DNA-binding LacI/PurR family transcriptional regulator [Gleimia europaea]